MKELRYIVSTALAVAIVNTGFTADFLSGGVPAANTKGNPAVTSDNKVATGFALNLIAQGSDPLENPIGIITKFGELSDGTKTEPDENTYLVLDHNPGGPTAEYDYGRHFVFQGHENGSGAYLTRVNLDVQDPAHRITLLTTEANPNADHTAKPPILATPYTRIDGSIFNPFTQTLLFSQEDSAAGGIIEINVDWPPNARTRYGSIGHGAYEGMRVDNWGNIILAEDAGGTSVSVNPANKDATPKVARNPNSYIYRFLPKDIEDLSQGGKLQALQVSLNGAPIKFVPVDAAHPFGAVFSTVQLFLHTPGTAWPVRWVTIHDTDVNGTAVFDANLAARGAGATPFKRPENLDYLPGSGFQTFFFAATGDTDARSANVAALAARGAWGAIFRVDLDQTRDKGVLSLFFLGDSGHNSFDNLSFGAENILLATEDRGDGLHGQPPQGLGFLDSIWAFKTDAPVGSPVRLVALGLDPTALNVEDNEPTGLTVSDGDASEGGLLRTSAPGAAGRAFFTQQHGLNRLFEIVSAPAQ